MSLFPDTNVWSLLLRRDDVPQVAEVRALVRALDAGEGVVSTGLVLQELLQGFAGPKQRDAILVQFEAFDLLIPDREDHLEAASIRNACRRAGIQVETIDALIAQMCIRHGAVLVSLDSVFRDIAKRSALMVWSSGS